MAHSATDKDGGAGRVPQAATGSAAKLVMDGIGKRFRIKQRGQQHEFLALDDVNLEIRDREFVSVIGPSGSGKTTLLKIVAGLLQPDAGEVRIDGVRVTEPGPDRAVVFQTFGLFPWKTVLDNVSFPLTIRNRPKHEAQETARRFVGKVGLDGFEDAYPHQLSGGMQQRVGLARALAADPQILLMDEPFGAIDAQTRELMQEELLRLWSDARKCVMFVTHDLDEAVLLADRVVVLSSQPGTVQAVIDVPLPRPRWEYDVRSRKEFAEIRHEIWSMLREGLVKARSDRAAPAGS
ncbi:MAG: ABC transporter ATP-binding protein [Trueperaceae bacterium]